MQAEIDAAHPLRERRGRGRVRVPSEQRGRPGQRGPDAGDGRQAPAERGRTAAVEADVRRLETVER